MRPPHTLPVALARTLAGLSLAVLLVTATGCMYDHHRNMGATEKLEGSGLHTIPKAVLFPFVAITDSLISPITMACDLASHDEQYHPAHHYFSYSGSRTIARSQMGMGWQWAASVPSIIIETCWLIVTGPIDLVTVLVSGDETSDETTQD